MLRGSANGICVGIVLALAAATAAQQSQTPSVGQERPTGVALRPGERITVIGCVVREGDYAGVTAAPSAGAAEATAAAEFVIASVATVGPAFSATGRHEPELAQHVGRRVEVAGTVEAVRGAGTDQPVTGTAPGGSATGVTPAGSPAHEPGDALPGTVPIGGGSRVEPRAATAAAAIDVGELPRLNISSVRRVEGDCPAPSSVPAVDSRTTPDRDGLERVAGDTGAPAGTPPGSAAVQEPITVRGCLVRWTPTGGAFSAAEGDHDLALTRASVTGRDRRDPVSAVPESQPSARNSGTVPERPTADAPAGDDERAFMLESGDQQLAQFSRHVGQLVEIVGTVRAPADTGGPPSSTLPGTATPDAGADVAPASSPAHHSAPTERLRVESFLLIGGNCF